MRVGDRWNLIDYKLRTVDEHSTIKDYLDTEGTIELVPSPYISEEILLKFVPDNMEPLYLEPSFIDVRVIRGVSTTVVSNADAILRFVKCDGFHVFYGTKMKD